MASKIAQLAESLPSAKCIPADAGGLTPMQQEALHAFKFEVLASLHRLYMVVPKELADPLIDGHFPVDPPKAR